MKINLALGFALVAAATAFSAPLTETTTVHAKPDKSAPALAVLNSGTEPELAPLPADPVPAGWEAVVVATEKEAFVGNNDIAKSLDIKIGAVLRSGPKSDAPIIGRMEAGDFAEIVAVKGRWHKVKYTKKTTGYIFTGKASAQPALASAPAPTPAAAPAPAPAAPSATSFAGAGKPAETVSLGESAALPRLFQGTFGSSRRPLMPRRPYDFQLNDANGDRYAYLDISKLLLTEQIDKYIDHTVVVYGTAKPVPNTRDIVIEVESLQLR